MEEIKRFLYYFGENKRSIPVYIFSSFAVGLLELCSIALVYPLILYIMSDNSNNRKMYIIIFASVILFLFILKNLAMVLYVYFQTKLIKNIELEMVLKFMKYFVFSQYSNVSKISLHEKSQILNFLVPNVINNCIFRILNLIVNCSVFILISAFLIIKFTFASIVAIALSIILIKLEYSYLKPFLHKIAKKLKEFNLLQNKNSNDILLNLKCIKISACENHFYNSYKNSSVSAFGESIKAAFIGTVPPYIVEPFIILVLFILIAIITVQSYYDTGRLIASYALIATAMFRLAPIISRIQVNLNGLNSYFPYLREILDMCDKFQILNIRQNCNTVKYQLKESIELKNVSFEYEQGKKVLNNINLRINKGEFVGITGVSGAGKTTLADIITGLYSPTEGEFLVDNEIKSGVLNIGYIPQEYTISNASIRENVAFGYDDIDDEKVINALKMAQLYNYIYNNYSDGIYANPFVDNTGLSQGQKQRLIIARALYSEPDILILDEATSSLDIKTEDEICNVLQSIKGNVTIIAIAHRLSTIKSTDKIVFMDKGKILSIDNFDNLYMSNDEFKRMVDLSTLN